MSPAKKPTSETIDYAALRAELAAVKAQIEKLGDENGKVSEERAKAVARFRERQAGLTAQIDELASKAQRIRAVLELEPGAKPTQKVSL